MVRYELFNGSKEITKCCSTPQLMDDLYKIDETDEMLNAENNNLQARVYELEKKVQSQEDELVCLRSSTADFLRRLTLLEQTAQTTTTQMTGVQSTSQQSMPHETDVFKRLSTRPHHSAERPRPTTSCVTSQSTLNLHSNSSLALKNGYHGSTSVLGRRYDNGEPQSAIFQGRNNRVGVLSRRFTRKSDENSCIVNVPTGRSPRGSPMRKWMSSADMKFGNSLNNNTMVLSRISDDGFSSTPNGNLLKNAKSFNRLGSLNSLAASHRSLTHIGSSYRDPIYLVEQRMLQVFIRGKATLLPVPSSVPRVAPLAEIDPPFRTNPRLEWVYGCRCKDSRNNLHVLPTGEIVYFVGAVVVLYNSAENLQRHYTEHTSEVKCIAIHPNKLHIATGQMSRHSPEKKLLNEHRSPICSPAALDSVLESDQSQAHVRIWDSVTLKTIKIIGVGEPSFEKGVDCVAFSRLDGGALLAVIDNSFEHTLSVWEWQRRKKLSEAKSANDQVFACEFHPSLRNSLVLYGKGHFNFWVLDGNELIKKAVVFEGRDKPKFVLSVCFVNSHVVSGDSNGTITLWDFKSVKAVKRAVKAHDGGVFALCALEGGRIISGGKDRCLIEWNKDLIKLRGPILIFDDERVIRCITPLDGSLLLIGTTKNEILKGDMKLGFKFVLQGHAEELWALSSRPNVPQFLTGSIDGTLRLWNSFSRSMVWSMVIQEGITSLDFHFSGDIFAVGTVLGIWTVYNADTRELVFLCQDATQPISILRFSPDGKMIAVASKDAQVYIYSVSDDLKHFSRTVQLLASFLICNREQGLNSFITTIDWSSDSTLIRSNNNDFEQHIWNATTGRVADAAKARSADWASSRCIVSFENGCIAQSIPGIMAIERSPNLRCVAVAIDNGAIRLYQYPTTSIAASYNEIFGHNAFIGNLGFVQSKLISIGATDSAIFQWNI